MSDECCGSNEPNTNEPDVTPGSFGWNELNVPDVEAAKKFYGEVFGWEAQTEEMAPGMEYTIFTLGKKMVAGLCSPPAEAGAPPHWAAYINSPNLESDVAKAKAAGATILVESMEVPNAGTFAVIQDPQGAVFSLWKPAEEAG